MQSRLLSICITSYNRTYELLRCVNSIDTKYIDDVEIVISEDNSPKKNEIQNLVTQFTENTPYRVLFNSNTINLGYDKNLDKLINLASSKYIIFISDDDVFIPGALDPIIGKLKMSDIGCAITNVQFGMVRKDRNYSSDFSIKSGVAGIYRHLYDPILFSGLVFRRELVNKLDAKRFLNLNYYQVYLFYYSLLKEGGRCFSDYVVDCIGDGENGYGTTELSGHNPLLKDRTSFFSNLEFHRGLVKTIELFDQDNNTNIIKVFSKEYSKRTVTGLLAERKNGFKNYMKFCKKLSEVPLEKSLIVNIYKIVIGVLGYALASILIGFVKKIYLKIRL